MKVKLYHSQIKKESKKRTGEKFGSEYFRSVFFRKSGLVCTSEGLGKVGRVGLTGAGVGADDEAGTNVGGGGPG